MHDKRYPIHGEPGTAWVLVFDSTASKWVVEEIKAGPRRRIRHELEVFEASEVGKPLAERIAEAITKASRDASR